MERTRTIKNVTLAAVEEVLNDYENNELIECLEGSLIDNYLIYGSQRDIYIFCKETYVNPWCSDYTVYYGNKDKIWKLWEEFERAYREEYPEE